MSTLTFGFMLSALVGISVFLGVWIGIHVRQKDDCHFRARVVIAAQKLAVAGESVGVGELPSSRLHELYDAVREYEVSQL